MRLIYTYIIYSIILYSALAFYTSILSRRKVRGIAKALNALQNKKLCYAASAYRAMLTCLLETKINYFLINLYLNL